MNNKTTRNLDSLFVRNVFASSTFDNIKAKFRIKHKPLGDPIPYDNNHSSMTKRQVSNNIENANVSVRSSKDGEYLTIDGSYIKWLTGQNVVGSADLIYLCLQVFIRVCKALDLNPDQKEIDAITEGCFDLLRVDYAVHCDAGDEKTVIFLQRQIKRHWAFRRPNYSHYKYYETLYLGQSSKRRTFKTYMKGREIQDKGGLVNVLFGNKVELISKRLLRLELTWRSKALSEIKSKTHPDLFLRKPLAWKGKCAQKLMKSSIKKLLGEIAGMTTKPLKKLNNTENTAIAAHKAGISIADIYDNRGYKRLRDNLYAKTGIDINFKFGKSSAASGLLTAQSLINSHIKYRAHRNLVDQMMKHVDEFDLEAESDVTDLIG